MRVLCNPGCTCGRHVNNVMPCPDDCTCKKHSNPGRPRTAYPKRPQRHARIKSERGKASEHKCEHCKVKQAEQWAHIHDTDQLDINNYKPLCRKCHYWYDEPAKPREEGRWAR